MQFDIDILKQKLNAPLPGKSSHLKMAPLNRAKALSNNAIDVAAAKQSAVLILLFKQNDVLKMIVIRRSNHVGIHAGQIAFPGGRYEDDDLTVLNTALREIHEEIGITKDEVEVLGRLSDIYVPPSNFLISVFVGFLNKKPNYKLQQSEVAEVIEIPFNTFLQPDIIKHKNFYVSEIKDPSYAPYYDVPNASIWGASAMVISELIDVLIA